MTRRQGYTKGAKDGCYIVIQLAGVAKDKPLFETDCLGHQPPVAQYLITD